MIDLTGNNRNGKIHHCDRENVYHEEDFKNPTRHLLLKEYGFITTSELIMDSTKISGFIQKQEKTKLDFTTKF